MKKTFISAIAAFGVAAALPFSAFALEINAVSVIDDSATTTHENDNMITNSAKANVGADVSVGGSEKSVVAGSVSANANAKAEVETQESASGSEETASSSEHAGVGNTVSVSATEIRGWDTQQKNDFLATVKATAQVNSDQDLSNFAKGVLVKDQNVKSVSAEKNEVKVDYKMPAKFLGIFSTTLTQEATVTFDSNAQSQVKVKFPWYGFLFSKGVSTTDVDTAIKAQLQATSTVNETQRSAQALEAASAAMKAQYNAAVSANSK